MGLLNFLVWTIFCISIVTAARHRRHHSQNQDLSQQTTPVLSTESDGDAQNFLSSWIPYPELGVVHRVVSDCQNSDDFTACLKQKALVAISRAFEKDTIKITDGLILEKQNHTDGESFISSVADARTLSALDRALIGRIDQLVRTYALKMDMSTGRDKKKKKGKGGGHMKYVIAALVTAMGIAGPLGLKALAAIAVKALVISKVALTIAGIIALKKLFAHEHSEETSFQVHAGEHNRRNTYVIRPVPKASASPLASTSGTMDPYRYYYEYHQ